MKYILYRGEYKGYIQAGGKNLPGSHWELNKCNPSIPPIDFSTLSIRVKTSQVITSKSNLTSQMFVVIPTYGSIAHT